MNVESVATEIGWTVCLGFSQQNYDLYFDQISQWDMIDLETGDLLVMKTKPHDLKPLATGTVRVSRWL